MATCAGKAGALVTWGKARSGGDSPGHGGRVARTLPTSDRVGRACRGIGRAGWRAVPLAGRRVPGGRSTWREKAWREGVERRDSAKRTRQ
eukprot:scaffold106143_cov54-Phaeocystis_antarctica.AAC.1